MSDAFFFGRGNEPGHFWWEPGFVRAASDPVRLIACTFDWIDGGYAPRQWRADRILHRKLVINPGCCFIAEGRVREDRHRIEWDTEEYPQGMFLVHYKTVLPAAERWSLMSWWDRAQGDTRSACNSNIVARGQLSSDELFTLLAEKFPPVAANLAKAGIVLRECGAVLA